MVFMVLVHIQFQITWSLAFCAICYPISDIYFVSVRCYAWFRYVLKVIFQA